MELPEPNPEWEAKADAFHAAGREECGPVEPEMTLTMLKRWKADAAPANEHGQVSFARAMLDSATDALEACLAGEHSFVGGLVAMREMLARFVEQGGDATTANSLRLNWNPSWGPDPLSPTPHTEGSGQ